MNTILFGVCFAIATTNLNFRVILNKEYRGQDWWTIITRVLEWIFLGWLVGRVCTGALVLITAHSFVTDLTKLSDGGIFAVAACLLVLNILGTCIERKFDERRYLTKSWYYKKTD